MCRQFFSLVVLFLATFGHSQEWPSGFFDKYGELSYEGAQKLVDEEPFIGKSPDSMINFLRKHPESLTAWKRLFDLSASQVSPEVLKRTLRLFSELNDSQIKRSRFPIYAFVEYGWHSISSKNNVRKWIADALGDRSKASDDVLRQSWLKSMTGFSNSEDRDKNLLMRAAADTMSSPELRSTAQHFRRRKGSSQFIELLEGKSFLTTRSSEGLSTKEKNDRRQKGVQWFKELSRKYPKYPTPYFVLYFIDIESMKKYYSDMYRKLENRQHLKYRFQYLD